MPTSFKIFIGAVAVVIVAGFIAGGYFYPKAVQSLGSAVGSTFSTAKVAAVNMAPLTGTASTTSLLNTDGSARWVKSVDTFCTGVGTSQTFLTGAGLSGWTVQAATTSVPNLGLQGNTNLAGNVSIGTSTPFEQSASSTITSTNSVNTDLYYWAPNTYMTFAFNATNTAACTVSVSYSAS